jgi:ABC-2 type transport system ATP-binding protein
MSSHILAEVARLAGRIGIIHQGRLLQELNMDELEQNRKRRLLLRARETEAAQQALIAAGQPAEILPDGSIELKSATAIERPDEISSLLVKAGTPPTQLVVEEEELEQYFLRLVGMRGEKQNE